MQFPDLPVVEALPRLLAALDTQRRVVLEAPPGAGKTTVVPLALLGASWRNPTDKILVLEPRQLAVRAAAARLAQLLNEPVGRTVGYRVRLDSQVSAATRIEVITEGILTRMIQDDPALEGVACVVFDEFHERSLNADLGLALALDVQSVLRDDLRILLMSATLQAERLGAWLPGPVISSQGFLFAIDTHYLDPRTAAGLPARPRERLAQLVPRQVRQALDTHPSGDVLVFLPGVGDLQRVHSALENTLPQHVHLHLLHGELPLETQQQALRPAPAGQRKVILSTSIAETSLTIEGVAVVVDSGYSRVPRYVPRTGFSTLETVPVSQAEADQRRGRAGRLGPGTCYRLYTTWERETYPRHRPPEIVSAELSGLALETAVWGTAPQALRWLDAPPAGAVAQATDLLLRLGAASRDASLNEELRMKNEDAALNAALNEELGMKNEELTRSNASTNSSFLLPHSSLKLKATPHGRQMARLGLPPRLAHLVLRGQALGLGLEAARLAALLAERDLLRWATPTDTRPLPPDLRLRLEALATGRPPLPDLALHPATLARVRDVARNLTARLPKNQTPNSQHPTPKTQPPAPNPENPPLSTKHQALGTNTALAALAYPERLAQRETPERLRLATGQRVALRTEDVDARAGFFAVAHLAGDAAQPRAALAAPLALADIELLFADQIVSADEVAFDPATGRVAGRRTRRLGALLLADAPLQQPAPALVAQALLAYLQASGLPALAKLNWTPAARQLQQRLEFVRTLENGLLVAGSLFLVDENEPSTPAVKPQKPNPEPQVPSTKHQAPNTKNPWPACSDPALLADLPAWLGPHLLGLRTLEQVQRLDLVEPLLARLPGGWPQRQELDRLAPAALEVPSGSHVTLSYENPAQPVLAVKLQELFGLTETPAVGGGRVPLLLHLLSPGGRPAQVTQDLRSFWEKGYFDVRKDLKNRYPKHPWPDKPMEHIPTRLTKKRLGG